jgi:hypothetical protein
MAADEFGYDPLIHDPYASPYSYTNILSAIAGATQQQQQPRTQSLLGGWGRWGRWGSYDDEDTADTQPIGPITPATPTAPTTPTTPSTPTNPQPPPNEPFDPRLYDVGPNDQAFWNLGPDVRARYFAELARRMGGAASDYEWEAEQQRLKGYSNLRFRY